MGSFFLILIALVAVVTSDNITSSLPTTTAAPTTTFYEPKGQIIAADVAGEPIPPAKRVVITSSSSEPSLGLHGITEQQLNLRYYNFICSSHFHLDCKITETLQICIKDRYVAVLGLPLSFENGSQDISFLSKWIRQCDQNDQDMNQEAMRVIRKRIHYQNENNWENVFKSSLARFGISSFVLVLINIL